MGRFIEEMTRLREDTDCMSEKRKSFINNLGKDVAKLKSDSAQMQARFRDDHRKMAEAEKNKRVVFLNGLTTYVSDLQAGFRQGRKEMNEKTTRGLNAFMSDIRAYVADLGDTVSQMQDELSKNRVDMASTLRSELQKAVKNTVDAVFNLKTETFEMQENFRKNFAQASHKHQKDRAAFLSDLKNDVDSLQQAFNSDRLAAAHEMKAQFALTSKQLKNFVSDLGTTVYQMQNNFRKTHGEMAEEAGKDRHAFIEDVVQSVTDLKDQVSQFRKAFADDLDGARSIWNSKQKAEDPVTEDIVPGTSVSDSDAADAPGSPEMPVKASSLAPEPEDLPSEPEEKLTTPDVAPDKVEVVEKKTDDAVRKKKGDDAVKKIAGTTIKKKDDLTYIMGIGPGRLKQLNASGIFTFEQLGESTPEQLRELLGESSRLVDVKKWIEQARDFT